MNYETNVSFPYDEHVSFERLKTSTGWFLIGENKMLITIFISIGVIFPFGIAGNGIVLWLLGFCRKRSPFTTYILNLAGADFGTLIFLLLKAILLCVSELSAHCLLPDGLHLILEEHFLFMYSISQLFRTAILINIFVLNSHQRSWVLHLTSSISTVIWACSFLFCETGLLLHYIRKSSYYYSWPHFILNVFISTKLMTICTLILIMKVYSESQPFQHRHLTAILFASLSSIIFTLPLNALYFNNFHRKYPISASICFISAALNSSVNPLIYFWVERRKGRVSKESIKDTFQRVFREEEDRRKEVEPHYYNSTHC